MQIYYTELVFYAPYIPEGLQETLQGNFILSFEKDTSQEMPCFRITHPLKYGIEDWAPEYFVCLLDFIRNNKSYLGQCAIASLTIFQTTYLHESYFLCSTAYCSNNWGDLLDWLPQYDAKITVKPMKKELWEDWNSALTVKWENF